jgi:hypothetical protein
MSEGDFLYLINLDSRMPMFELYNSKVEYRTTGGAVPHLTPRLGADLPYEILESLSHDIYWDSYNRFMGTVWGSENLYRERGWLWIAALVTKRRARYDRVWFSLLVLLRDRKMREPAYLRLSELTSALVKLNTAEHQLRSQQAEESLRISREALRSLRAERDKTARAPALDLSKPTLEALILNYRPVLERELWLVLGNSLAALGRGYDAKLAYREVLKYEPQQWRAYAGLLWINIQGDDVTFNSVLGESQSALRMRGWTDQLPLGYPGQFFDERALRRMRSTKNPPARP